MVIKILCKQKDLLKHENKISLVKAVSISVLERIFNNMNNKDGHGRKKEGEANVTISDWNVHKKNYKESVAISKPTLLG